ncbi:sterol desaturase family protein [Pseudoroseomonas wenyumeiae]
MMDAIQDAWNGLNGWLFEAAVQPALYALGLMAWAEDAFDWMDFFMFGLLQVAIVYAICRPLEAWKPVERWGDRRRVRVDILYTMLARLGILPLIAFIAFSAMESRLAGLVADSGWVPPTLETLVPALREYPLLALLTYIVVMDFGEYWRHRFQHTFGWWWALHSIHHAQTQMTFWTDDRNHVLDDVIGALWFGGLALLIGVPPGQFPLVVIVLRLAESLSHANIRLSFGAVGERLLVSPLPPAAPWPGAGPGQQELRRAAAHLGLDLRHSRFPPRLFPADRRWLPGRCARAWRLAAAADGGAAAAWGGADALKRPGEWIPLDPSFLFELSSGGR